MDHSRSLPLDLAALAAFLPPEPVDGATAAARAAVDRIDTLAAQLAAQLDRYDSAEQALVDALVDAAVIGDNLATLAAKIDPGQRPAIEHRLALVGKARNQAVYRLGVAQRSDPAYLAWQRQCTEIRNEWTELMSDTAEGSDIDRLRHLEAFAASH